MELEIQDLIDELKQIKLEIKKCETIDMDRATKEFLIDFMNLIFGSGEETDIFWTNVINKECIRTFRIYEVVK